MEDLNFLEELCSYEPSSQNEEEFSEKTIEEQVERFDDMFDQPANEVITSITSEYVQFKEDMLAQSKERIFDSGCRITFYREMYDMLSAREISSNSDWEILHRLKNRGVNLLLDMFHEFCNDAIDVDITSWESLKHFIHSYCQNIDEEVMPF